MLKLTLYVVLFLGLYSCDVFYEDNKRLLFTGKVIDENGVEINNLPVIVYTYGPSAIGGRFRENLAEGITDENGNFNLTSLSPQGNNQIDLEINPKFANGHSQAYATATLIGVENSVLQDGAYRLRNLRLERIVNSRLTIKRVTNEVDTLYLSFHTNPTEKVFYFDSSLEPVEIDFSFFPSDTLLPSETEKNILLRSILAKDTIEVHFKLTNVSTAPVGNEKLTLGSNSDSYEFEF